MEKQMRSQNEMGMEKEMRNQEMEKEMWILG